MTEQKAVAHRARRRPRPALWLATGLLVSAALHVALGWGFRDWPLAEIRAAPTPSGPAKVTMRRPPTSDPALDGAGAASAAAEAPAPDPKEVSRAMLAEEEAPAPEAPESSAAAPILREREERPAGSRRPAGDGSGVRLPDRVSAALARAGGGALARFGASPGAGKSAGGDGEAGGDPGGAARRALRAETAAGAGDRLAAPAPAPPDGAPRLDASPDERPRRRRKPAAAAGLVGEALDATTRLEVPEHLDNDFTYDVATYAPSDEPEGGLFGLFEKKPPSDGRSYFRVRITPKPSLEKLTTMGKDVIFLVDTSESVSEAWVERATRGVESALGALNEGDRFNIVLFKESPSFLSTDGLRRATPESLADAGRFLRGAASSGYTNVNQALSRLLSHEETENRVYDLILISDGRPTRGVMDTRRLINLITRDNRRRASIYGVGIGAKQNRKLLEFLAYRNKGFCRFVERPAETVGVIRSLMSRLRYPILKGVEWNVAGLDGESIYPKHLPNIHRGERFTLYGRFAEATRFTMRLRGENAGQPVDFTYAANLAEAREAKPALAERWAFWKLHHLYNEILRRGRTEKLERAVDRMREEYGLETVY